MKKFLVIAAVVLFAASMLYFFSGQESVENAKADAILFQLSGLQGDEYRSYYTVNIDILFKAIGIHEMITNVTTALEEERIDMFVCHSMAHDIGHYAGYEKYFSDIESNLSKRNLDFCGSGFMHGVEGELANHTYPSNVDHLFEFCNLALAYSPYYNGCYHGAGHAFMENEPDIAVALTFCDQLTTTESITAEHCYRGVFSQNAIYAHAENQTPAERILFCDSQSGELMQSVCASELNGLELPAETNQEEINEYIKLCTEKSMTKPVKLGCVRSVATVSLDRLQGIGKKVIVPSAIAVETVEVQEAYLQGIFGAVAKYPSGSFFEETFCESFVGQEVHTYCVSNI